MGHQDHFWPQDIQKAQKKQKGTEILTVSKRLKATEKPTVLNWVYCLAENLRKAVKE
jgi:hypothetical protein